MFEMKYDTSEVRKIKVKITCCQLNIFIQNHCQSSCNYIKIMQKKKKNVSVQHKWQFIYKISISKSRSPPFYCTISKNVISTIVISITHSNKTLNWRCGGFDILSVQKNDCTKNKEFKKIIKRVDFLKILIFSNAYILKFFQSAKDHARIQQDVQY